MTHEEFIFQKQILGKVLDYEIKDEVLYIKESTYYCNDEVLPDNIVFTGTLNISNKLKYLPKGLKVHKGLVIIGSIGHITQNNYHITETPKDMIVLGSQYYCGCPNLKYLNHLEEGDKINGVFDVSFTSIEVLPRFLTIDGHLDIKGTNLLKILPFGLHVTGDIFISCHGEGNKKFINDAMIGGDIWAYSTNGSTNIKGDL